MADRKQNKRLSKIIDYMLAKAPGEFGLIPDEDGFVKIKDLLLALHDEEGWRHVRQATLDELTMTVPDVPFEISDNRIRSRQAAALPPPAIARTVPRLLFTCIRQRAYPHVLRKGIAPTTHTRVVLSSDKALAEKIGSRRSPDPVTLTIHTDKAEQQGVIFYQAGESLYLADYVPEGCFSGPALPREREKKTARSRVNADDGLPLEGTRNRAGAFLINPAPDIGSPTRQRTTNKKDPDWKRERKRMNRRGHKK